jgi:cell shape-determining protein MreD
MKRLKVRKNRLIIWFLAAIAFIIIDSQAGLYGYRTNCSLLIIYYLAAYINPVRALIFAGLIGLIIDSISLRFIGPNILAYGIVVMIIVFARIKIINWTALFNFVLGFSVTFASGLIGFLCLAIFDTMPVGVSEAFYISFFQGVLNGIIAYIFWIKDE